MSVFDTVTKKVTETAKAAAKKSNELVEVTKLNINIGSEDEKIAKVYTDIGKMVYASFLKGEETNDAYKVNFEKIKSYEENISKMKQKILELKSAKLCPGCSEELDISIAFCPKCGTKQELEKPIQEETETQVDQNQQ